MYIFAIVLATFLACARKILNYTGNVCLLQVVAVAARDVSDAKAFAERFGIHKAYGSYSELAQDKDVGMKHFIIKYNYQIEQSRYLQLPDLQGIFCKIVG